MTATEASYGQREIKDGPTDPKYIAMVERCEARRAAREAAKAAKEMLAEKEAGQ